MKKVVIPSLIAKNQEELNDRFSKVRGVSSVFQLDVMDGKFVKNKSLVFDFKIPKVKGKKYEADLMVSNPRKWIEKNWRKTDTIIFHVETCKNVKEVCELIDFVRSKKRRVGIALNPETPVKKISQFLGFVDLVLIMSVKPGKYGSKFIPKMLNKVKEIRKLNSKVDIEVDGGMNDKTIKLAAKAGANRFVVGSFLQGSEDVKKSVGVLKEKLR